MTSSTDPPKQSPYHTAGRRAAGNGESRRAAAHPGAASAGRGGQSDSVVLAIDIGTTSIKAACVGMQGHVRALSVHRVGAPSAARWREACGRACREAVSSARSHGSEWPSAVVFSGNGPSVVAVDVNGNEVSDTLLWYDGRKIERVQGCPSFFLPSIAWL
ncbi:MAG: hypothetical protein ACOCRN_05785, partial [Spirochaetia bacterium]